MVVEDDEEVDVRSVSPNTDGRSDRHHNLHLPHAPRQCHQPERHRCRRSRSRGRPQRADYHWYWAAKLLDTSSAALVPSTLAIDCRRK